MASGIYNRTALTAATYATMVSTTQVDTGKIAVVTVNIVNRSSTASVSIRLALTTTPTAPVNGEFLEFDTLLNPSGVLERTGIVVPRGMALVAYSSAATVDVIAYGFEG